jgi:ribonucleoside-diphosphate reductase alpha chain
MYRSAWHLGLKTTYYLRSLGASNIEKATVAVKKEIRGAMKDGPHGTDAVAAAVAKLSAAEGAAGSTVPKRVYTEAEKTACSIEAMRNGETCEACQ